MLQSEVLSADKMKSIMTKVDGTTYSTACHKAIYSGLEYQVIHVELSRLFLLLQDDVADGKAQLRDEVPELQDNQRRTITAIPTNPAVIIGLHFEHMWFVNNQNVLYQGHVLSVKCSKRSNMPKVTVTYWKHDENQDEGDVYPTCSYILAR